MRVDGRVATAAFMLALFAAMAARAAMFPPEARLVPLAVSLPATVLCGYVLWSEVTRMRRDRGVGQEPQHPDRPRDIREQPARFVDEVALIVWLWAFAGAIIAAGFLVGGTLATLAFVRFRLREPVTVTLGTAAVAYLTLYLVFERMLGQVLFQGLIVGG